MRYLRRCAALFAIFLPAGISGAASPAQDDWAEARKASCQELIDAYRTTVAAERRVVAQIRDSNSATVTGNAVGLASLALFGIGFFSWDDNASAEENLADLRNDIGIIRTVASEKKCELPANP